MKAWFTGDMPWESLGSSDPDPVRVESGIERLLRSLGAPRPVALASLFDNWADMVGDTVAANVHPVKLSDTTLKVVVDDPSWASQMKWMATDVLKRLDEGLGEGVVTSIDVTVANPGRSRRTKNDPMSH